MNEQKQCAPTGAEALRYHERSIITSLGPVTCLYGPPSKMPKCDMCRNRNKGRYRIAGVGALCFIHASKWAFETLIGEENISDATYGRRGGDDN